MRAPVSIEWQLQLIWLAVMGLVVACLAWTVTHEEIAREAREYCQRRAREDSRPWVRKSFYVFTCEYCLSHWLALGVVALTGFRMLLDDWRGYLVSIVATVAVANFYMSAFGRLRQEVKSESLEAKRKEQVIERSRQVQGGEEKGGRRPGRGAGAQRPAGGSPGSRSAPEPWPPSASASASQPAPGSGPVESGSGIATRDG
jgi:small-conductance mechanosensitive channel